MSAENLSIRVDTQSETYPGRFSAFTLCTIAIIAVGFWFVDHVWGQSKYFTDIDETVYRGTENATADRLSEVNANSTSARLVIAAWACLCLVTSRGARLRWGSAMMWATLCLGSILFSSVLWSVLPRHTLFKLVVIATTCFSAVGLVMRFPIRQVLEIIAIVCLFFVGIGVLAEISLGTFRPWGSYRFIGTCHPNTLAIYGAFMCLISRMYLVKDQPKTAAILLFAIGAMVIVMTKSRTTLGAACLAMLATQIICTRGNNRLMLLTGGMFVIGALSLGSMFINQKTVGAIGNVAAMGRGDDVSSLTGRLPLWEELITSINKQPVFGYGYLAYWDSKRVEYLSETFRWEIPHGHNMYLDVTLDIGIVGLMSFLMWHACALGTAISSYNRSNQVEYAIIAGIGIFALINGAAESHFKIPTFNLFTLILAYSCLLVERIEPRIDARRLGRAP